MREKSNRRRKREKIRKRKGRKNLMTHACFWKKMKTKSNNRQIMCRGRGLGMTVFVPTGNPFFECGQTPNPHENNEKKNSKKNFLTKKCLNTMIMFMSMFVLGIKKKHGSMSCQVNDEKNKKRKSEQFKQKAKTKKKRIHVRSEREERKQERHNPEKEI